MEPKKSCFVLVLIGYVTTYNYVVIIFVSLVTGYVIGHGYKNLLFPVVLLVAIGPNNFVTLV